MIQKPFCTTVEAAQRLGISPRTVQQTVEKGQLDAWKTPGGHRRISVRSIERLLTLQPEDGQQACALPGRGKRTALSALIVDESAVQRRIYEAVLARWPLKMVLNYAGDGYEALIALGRMKPDLLITDLQLPGLDGFRLLGAICATTSLSGMAIAVVTGLGGKAIHDLGGLPDGIRLFHKPVPFDPLLQFAQQVAAGRPAVDQSAQMTSS